MTKEELLIIGIGGIILSYVIGAGWLAGVWSVIGAIHLMIWLFKK